MIELSVRIILFLLESQGKSSIIKPAYSHLSPEDTAGILSKVFFWWMNGILAQGNNTILHLGNIPDLDKSIGPSVLRSNILRYWDQRTKPENKATLIGVLFHCLYTPFFSITFPRFFLAICRCSQPLLIHEIITFIEQSQKNSHQKCDKFWILVAAITVYLGLAIFASLYRHRLNRLQLMLRGSLIALIYNKTLEMNFGVSHVGDAVSLMSTDVLGIADTGEMFHETWGQLLELIIGLFILERQVQWLWPVPLVIIFFCSRVSRFVARNIQSRQKDWNIATQERISALNTVLASVKSLKSIGLTDAIMAYICSLRQKEIDSSKHVRWMSVMYNASANALGIFTPVITVVLFAIIAKSQSSDLDVATVFTTVAVLAVVTHPANMIMTIVPRAVASFANFERIQAYLLEPTYRDQRQLIAGASRGFTTNTKLFAIQTTDVTINDPGNSVPVLSNINIQLPQGSTTICCGPVGSGKSVLAKMLLGEIQYAGGGVYISSTNFGFCDQKAWLPAGTFREIITGFSDNIDEQRYQDAIQACSLEVDIATFPEADTTYVSNCGINLSGGQQQRVALARVLYSRCKIAILDNTMTALDGTTEARVVANLFGSRGWFKKEGTTVLLIANSTQHFEVSGHVLYVDNGRVQVQSSDSMLGSANVIRKFEFGSSVTGHARQDVGVLEKPSTKPRAKADANVDMKDDLYRKTGDISLYGYYLKSAGVFNSLCIICCTASYSSFITLPHYWIKWWMEDDTSRSLYYIIGYILMAFAAWISTSGTMWATYILLAPHSGKKLHQSLLSAILGAPLSFFINIDIGITLNRFGHDIASVDRQLPEAFSALCNQIFKMMAQVLLLVKVQGILIFSLPFCVAVVFFIQRVYLRTSRRLRILEIESQSALYSSFLETVEGIVTIRSFKWQFAMEMKNLQYLNSSLRTLYMLLCLQRWLTLVLELIISVIAIGLISIILTRTDTTTGGGIGVALNLILAANSTLVRLVESWTGLEISLGAISRLGAVEAYTPREERESPKHIPDPAWPMKGDVRIRNLAAGYSFNSRPIVSNINLDILSGQKLVVCGRTGSGKSTIFLALLRLIESTGTVEVDGQDIANIPLSIVRQRCFITVSQDSFLMPDATLRFNLDASSMVSDQVLETALLKVGLWTHLCSTSTGHSQSPLYQRLSSLPALSVGQSQLLAMARAIARKYSFPGWRQPCRSSEGAPRPILLLDEATSSLDSVTELTIHNIIETEFLKQGHTVIIIAHRLSALTGSMKSSTDRLFLVQNGNLTEVDCHEQLDKIA
ncbi:P-loop containing nucleoside triphosphate hydrolase protein [Ilyonectria destructans]|nr:P-loop containing nucleoside triphosphate hydrolase protein [Ilyonectria destructans]